MAVTVASTPLHRNCRWSARRSHLVVAAAESEGARKNPQLRLVLRLGCHQRIASAQARLRYRYFSTIVVRACGLVDRVLEARPFHLRGTRSLAGIARSRRR